MYPVYLKNSDGTEICKVISPEKQLFVRCKYWKPGRYEYALEMKEATRQEMEYNYRYFCKEATASEFLELLKKYFKQNQNLYDALQDHK